MERSIRPDESQENASVDEDEESIMKGIEGWRGKGEA